MTDNKQKELLDLIKSINQEDKDKFILELFCSLTSEQLDEVQIILNSVKYGSADV